MSLTDASLPSKHHGRRGRARASLDKSGLYPVSLCSITPERPWKIFAVLIVVSVTAAVLSRVLLVRIDQYRVFIEQSAPSTTYRGRNARIGREAELACSNVYNVDL